MHRLRGTLWLRRVQVGLHGYEVLLTGHRLRGGRLGRTPYVSARDLSALLLCTTKYYANTTLYYKVVCQYYKVLLLYYSVLLGTTKYYSSTTLYYKVPLQYYSVLQSTTPVLLCTTDYYATATLYYKVLLQYYSVLPSPTPPISPTFTHWQYICICASHVFVGLPIFVLRRAVHAGQRLSDTLEM